MYRSSGLDRQSTSAVSWEDLRKQASHLENEIDLKLVQFGKLGINCSHKDYGVSATVDKTSDKQIAENVSTDLQQLLAKLTSVNERMSAYLRSPAAALTDGAQSSSLHHTLQRHWDILHDYAQEWRKISENMTATRDREELMQGVDRELKSASGAHFLFTRQIST